MQIPCQNQKNKHFASIFRENQAKCVQKALKLTHHYQDYFWKEGIPYGIRAAADPQNSEDPTYKIVMDPYRKHISIEKYWQLEFQGIIYDSCLLNFRHLKNDETRAWQKTTILESLEKTICHLRDQDDRLVFQETYLFDNHLCRECRVDSPHGISLSIQRMYYKTLNDSFNGLILFDQNAHPVIFKHYEWDEQTQEFTDLIEANWNMQHFKMPSHANNHV